MGHSAVNVTGCNPQSAQLLLPTPAGWYDDCQTIGTARAMGSFPTVRMRRNRTDDWVRRLVAETELGINDLIWPIFIIEGEHGQAITSMPGVERVTVDGAVKAAREAAALGIPAMALFPCIEENARTADGAEAYNPQNLICRTIRAIKAEIPNLGLVCDVALDPYTSHGHDGLVGDRGQVLNDQTVEVLIRQALVLAKAGCDIIAPSDMMDGRIGAIRRNLDQAGFQDVKIMSYAAKYASAFYGPFRDAIGTRTLFKGDKRTYQMDPPNIREAAVEVGLDINEGADMILIKPGLPYLDVIHEISQRFDAPIFAYQVSGEYAMIVGAAQNGWIEKDAAILESLLAFKRAGCRGIVTYFALYVARLLSEGRN
mgnify:CR=1 FL=1